MDHKRVAQIIKKHGLTFRGNRVAIFGDERETTFGNSVIERSEAHTGLPLTGYIVAHGAKLEVDDLPIGEHVFFNRVGATESVFTFDGEGIKLILMHECDVWVGGL